MSPEQAGDYRELDHISESKLDLITPIVISWRLIALLAAIGLVAGAIYELVAKPKFTATVVLAPAVNRTDPASMDTGGLSKLAGLAGAKLGSDDKVSNLERFRFLLDSRRLADWQIRSRPILRTLYAEKWDERAKAWRPPSGLIPQTAGRFRELYGLPAWQVPDAYSVTETYKRNLRQAEVGDTKLLRLNYVDTSPERARAVLRWIVEDADSIVKQDALLRAGRQASYLRERLKAETLQEYRSTLLSLLSQQEQTLMLANTNLPFAVDPIEDYGGSNIPTSKRPLAAMVLGALVGAILGYVIAVVRLNFHRVIRPHEEGTALL